MGGRREHDMHHFSAYVCEIEPYIARIGVLSIGIECLSSGRLLIVIVKLGEHFADNALTVEIGESVGRSWQVTTAHDGAILLLLLISAPGHHHAPCVVPVVVRRKLKKGEARTGQMFPRLEFKRQPWPCDLT